MGGTRQGGDARLAPGRPATGSGDDPDAANRLSHGRVVSIVSTEGVTWSRQPPRHAAGRFGWTLFLAVTICGPASLVFADEPRVADNGAVNPLALVVPALGALFAAILVPQLLALVRRPVVRADHYALTVRPGVGRTLVLPWAQIAELATVQVDEDTFLMVRCVPVLRGSGDVPRWWDQAHLRAATRGAPGLAAYDLAVPMNDFDGTPAGLLAQLAAYAPGHVIMADHAA